MSTSTLALTLALFAPPGAPAEADPAVAAPVMLPSESAPQGAVAAAPMSERAALEVRMARLESDQRATEQMSRDLEEARRLRRKGAFQIAGGWFIGAPLGLLAGMSIGLAADDAGETSLALGFTGAALAGGLPIGFGIKNVVKARRIQDRAFANVAFAPTEGGGSVAIQGRF